jgi:hypothetical protein
MDIKEYNNMKTYKINSQKDLKKFIVYSNVYHVRGNLKINCDLEFDGILIIGGYVDILSCWSITTDGVIYANKYYYNGCECWNHNVLPNHPMCKCLPIDDYFDDEEENIEDDNDDNDGIKEALVYLLADKKMGIIEEYDCGSEHDGVDGSVKTIDKLIDKLTK